MITTEWNIRKKRRLRLLPFSGCGKGIGVDKSPKNNYIEISKINGEMMLDTHKDLTETTSAIQQWLQFGDQSLGTAHQGYFSKGGWAYEKLKSLLPILDHQTVNIKIDLPHNDYYNGKWDDVALFDTEREEYVEVDFFPELPYLGGQRKGFLRKYVTILRKSQS